MGGKINKLSIIPPADIAHCPSTFISRVKKVLHKESTPDEGGNEVFVCTKSVSKDSERTLLLLQEIIYKLTGDTDPLPPLMERNPGITSDSQKNLATDSQEAKYALDLKDSPTPSKGTSERMPIMQRPISPTIHRALMQPYKLLPVVLGKEAMDIVLILQGEIHPRDQMVMAVLTARVHDRMEELILCLDHADVSPANIYPILEDVEPSMLGLNVR